jgi:hypothetical protein
MHMRVVGGGICGTTFSCRRDMLYLGSRDRVSKFKLSKAWMFC